MPQWIIVILGIIGAVDIVLNFTFLLFLLNGGKPQHYLNPLCIYQENRVNVFGCIMLTVLGNLAFSVVAIFYWFYKLCTVGRNK